MPSTGRIAHPPRDVPARGTRLATALAAAFCAVAVLLAAASFVPYEAVLSRLDGLASTGGAGQSYPPATHARLVLACRVSAAAAFGLGALSYRRRAALARAMAALGADARAAASDLRAAARAPGRAGRLDRAVLVGLTLVGAALRVAYMQRPPRGDEALMFVQFAQRPPPVIAADYSDVGNHIFHTLLMHASWLLLGETVWGMRLPDLIAGVLLIPATYAVARGLYGPAVAPVAAALVAGGSALVDYSVNGRGYVLQALLLLGVFGVARLQLHRERATWWAAWAVAAALAMWTVPTSAIALVGIGLWYWVSLLRRDGAGAWPGVLRLVAAGAAAGLLTAALYSPVLLTSGLGHLLFMMRSGSTDVALAGPLAALAAIWEVWTRNMPAPLGWLCLGLLGLGAAREMADARRGGIAPVGAVFALWLVAFYLATRTIGYARLWLPFAPFAYMLVALGLVECLRRSVPRRSRAGESPAQSPARPIPGAAGDAWIAAGVAPALLALLAATELHHRHVERPDGDSFAGAPALTAALPGLARPGERILAMQPYGSILRWHLRGAGVAHHTAGFRATASEPYAAVLAMGAADGRARPGTLLVVAPDGRESLEAVLRFYGLPGAREPVQALSRLPDVTLFRVPDTSAP